LDQAKPDIDTTFYRRSVAHWPNDPASEVNGGDGGLQTGWNVYYAAETEMLTLGLAKKAVPMQYCDEARFSWMFVAWNGKDACAVDTGFQNLFVRRDGTGHTLAGYFSLLAYRVPEDGMYSIADSLMHTSTLKGDGHAVYVDPTCVLTPLASRPPLACRPHVCLDPCMCVDRTCVCIVAAMHNSALVWRGSDQLIVVGFLVLLAFGFHRCCSYVMVNSAPPAAPAGQMDNVQEIFDVITRPDGMFAPFT
jgi:hypothetical protein